MTGDIVLPAATLCGIDLSGFTAWVDRALERRGTDGLEAIADAVDGFLGAAAAALAVEGYGPACLLGDGLIAIGDGGPDDRAAARLRDALVAIEPSARVAFVSGEAHIVGFDGWHGRRDVVLTGPAVDACHRLLAVRADRVPLHRPATPATASAAKLVEADIDDAVVGFVCLRASPVTAPLLGLVRARLPRWQAEAEAGGGGFERITHDDAGLLLRFAWPNRAGTRDLARDFIARLTAELAAETPVGGGIAGGPVFRARIAGFRLLHDHDLRFAQGPALNHAARAAKAGGRIEPPARRAVAVGAAAALDGRAAEIDWLRVGLATGRALLRVSGDPGIGKSHLLRALGEAVATDRRVVAVACRPQSCLDQLGVWTDVLDALATAFPVDTVAWRHALDRLDRNDCGLTASAVLEERNRQIVAIVAKVASRGPLLLVIDDVQWADTASRRLIERVAGDVAALRIVVAARSGFDDLLPVVDDRADLVVGRLDDTTLARAVAAAAGGSVAPETLAAANGNILHAIQLAFAAREGGGDLVGASIADVIDARLDALDPGDRALLRLLAVADRPLGHAALTRLAGAVAIDIDTGRLIGLAARALVTGGAATAEIVHRSVTDRVVARMPPSVRRLLHRQTGRMLARAVRANRLTASPGEIARHWRAADMPARAGLCFARDAETALTGASFEAAQALFAEAEASLEQGGADPSRLAVFRSGAGLAAWGRGDIRTAVTMARAARTAIDAVFAGGHGNWRPRGTGAWRGRLRQIAVLAGWRRPLSPRLRLALHRTGTLRGECGFFKGELREFFVGGLLSATLAETGGQRALARARGMGLFSLVLGLFGLHRPALALAARCRAIDPAGVPGLTAALAEAIWRLASGAWTIGEARLDEAEALIGEPPDPQQLGGVLCLRALALHLRGDHRGALTVFDALEQLADRASHRQFKAWALYGAAMPLVALGDFVAAEARTVTAQALLADNDDRLSDLNCLAIRAQSALAKGDHRAALDVAAAGVRLAGPLFAGNFGSLEGFSTPVFCVAAVLRAPGADPASRAAAHALRPAAMRLLARHRRACATAAPRYWLARAMLADRPAAARRAATRAVRAADALGMTPDARRARIFLAQLTEVPDDGGLYSFAR